MANEHPSTLPRHLLSQYGGATTTTTAPSLASHQPPLFRSRDVVGEGAFLIAVRDKTGALGMIQTCGLPIKYRALLT